MSNLIVIRIIPPSPIDGGTFTNYLSNNGGLQITAYDLSFNSPTSGTAVGTATYVAPAVGPTPATAQYISVLDSVTLKQATYAAGTSIVQQYDVMPAVLDPNDHLMQWSEYYGFQSAATAVIEVPSPPPGQKAYENLQLVAQWGTGPGAQPIPLTAQYYDVALAPEPSPNDPNNWYDLPPSCYLRLPAPATGTNPTNFSMPTDGSPPSFDALLAAVNSVLDVDPGGTLPDLGALTLERCRNIAYEIIWSQQGPVPQPPDPIDRPIETLYTYPTNTGNLIDDNKPNPYEGDRQEFEAKLAGYYATPNAAASRLTDYVFSLGAAVACEELSLAAKAVLLEFPVDPIAPYSDTTEIVLSGVDALPAPGFGVPAAYFGVPAAYFYGLAASMPSSVTASQRYDLALGDGITHTLVQLTSALNAKVITDAEGFTTLGATPPTINAAQAARRLGVLKVPVASPSPTLKYAPALTALVNDWLKFASTDPAPSSETYAPTDDNALFWPTAATSEPTAFLDFVLCALTQGFFIPAPTSTTLADEITQLLLTPLATPPTVQTLSGVTEAAWTAFFESHPTWLPPFTQPGNLDAQIDNFVRYVQKFFDVTDAGPATTVYYVTSADTPAGAVLPFVTTAGVEAAMSVSGTNIPPGTLVSSVTATTVTLSQAISADVPVGTTVKFTPNYQAAGAGDLPLLQAPSTDWLGVTLGSYQAGTFTFGSGFNLADLQTAAAKTFPGDQDAQDWVVEALVTIDALYGILGAVVPAGKIPTDLTFSVVEALYARGFTSAAGVAALSATDFQQALVGTVAYDFAGAISTAALTLAPAQTVEPGGDAFAPVNPDGSLINCIPAPCRSPLGPIAYLQEMLRLSPAATCETPFVPPASGQSSLADAIALRRGPLGQLAASCANLETPLPLIDIVNECLEFVGSQEPTDAKHGTVYDTSSDEVAGHALCQEACAPEPGCHPPGTLLSTLPEYSTPATPVAANGGVLSLVYNRLKSDFSACALPYSQALDVSRTYLRHFRTCRFEAMRTFRKCITEFVLDPTNPPTGFQSFRWRYPVRIDIAIEYLGITPEEYALLFQGDQPGPCAAVTVGSLGGGGQPGNGGGQPGNGNGGQPVGTPIMIREEESGGLEVWQLYGFGAAEQGWTEVVVRLPEFLARTCLTYCEFIDLWKSGFVPFGNGADEESRLFPDCQPCCPERLWLQFPGSQDGSQPLYQLAVFIRLWRKLKDLCGAGYSFASLRDLCGVLALFEGGVINPDFIRQLAAFQLLRDHFGMRLADRAYQPADGATGADRLPLLALWVGSASAGWPWAVQELIERIGHYARCHHRCEPRRPEFVKLLAANLDPLSRLAGFDPASATDAWHSSPTHTLRFAEVLAKIYASDFEIGELLYLFTADAHLDGEDPFPLQEDNEAEDSPLALPDEEGKFSLWELRRKLLVVQVADDEVDRWSWKRVESVLRDEFGYPDKAVLALGEHFFPATLEHAGNQVPGNATRFFTGLPTANTVAAMWNSPPDGPLNYDANSGQLWTQLPLRDEAVIRKLTHVRPLTAPEQAAVQDLYFQPRAMLAGFALLFNDFARAQERLVTEGSEAERWAFFRRQVVLCQTRCRIIAGHLAAHVAHATGQECPDGEAAAALILRHLLADENAAQPGWENDAGTVPGVTWTPAPLGGALAALLGLVGTGLVAEYTPDGGPLAWRDVTGLLLFFGRERDRENCPVPTVLPALGFQPAQPGPFDNILNGFAIKDTTGAGLGGAQGFTVKWYGSLLIEHEGRYEFWAGAPSDGKPDPEADGQRQWRVQLSRGQKDWILLAHDWPEQCPEPVSGLTLKRGAYDLIIEFRQPPTEYADEQAVRARHTGFELKYAGPDSRENVVALPHSQLFIDSKDQRLDSGIAGLSTNAEAYLSQLYVSSFRDIRRTYQRAFKASLFAHRFGLSAKVLAHTQSELGYMLAEPGSPGFAGVSAYRGGGGFVPHAADFDFNFLPLLDNYYPPAGDDRTKPSPQRSQAMFDWWERTFDYVAMRREVRHRCDRQVWPLFEEAAVKQPASPGYLLRHIGADSRHWKIDLTYYQDQNALVYPVTSADLEDERWVVRAWRADRWVRSLWQNFHAKSLADARPDLWASDDPSALVSGETQTGNANLSAYLDDGCLEDGAPARYAEVRQLNDGLRTRGRDALVAYLCRLDRVALPWVGGQFAQSARDLGDLLLVDVDTGLCEKASRIEEAISAVQNFVRRARLGLEPGWPVSRKFAQLWDRRFRSFLVWEDCTRRHLYKEDWIEWEELAKSRKIEAFRLLETRLRSHTLTIAAPGGLERWPDERPPTHRGLDLSQKCDPESLRLLDQPREGLNLLATPERGARSTRLAAVTPQVQASAPPVIGGPVIGKFPSVEVGQPTPADDGGKLPLWMDAAIRLGTRFCRIAAAGVPPAASGLSPHHRHEGETCCVECGCDHPALVDEYYFWLVKGQSFTEPTNEQKTSAPDDYQYGFQDDYYSQSQQQSTLWQDPTQLPQMLNWKPGDTVRLAWCRLHNGEFQQPRTSVEAVPVVSSSDADLAFVGRTADSLTFTVSNPLSANPPPIYQDQSAPGFRYDLATDLAVTLPQVTATPVSGVKYPGTLPCYPYFVYHAPGSSLFPLSYYSPAIAVGRALRSHCSFEAALKWYRLAFDPLTLDCAWMHCFDIGQTGGGEAGTPPTVGGPSIGRIDASETGGRGSRNPGGACCDSTDVTAAAAKHRSILLHYLETLQEWGDAAMRKNTPEAFQQARLLFDTMTLILGKTPRSILLPEPANAQTVADFVPNFAPLNPRLLDLYGVARDRLGLIHACQNAWRLSDGHVNRDMPYFGHELLRDGWRGTAQPCADEAEWCHLQSPYRFLSLIQKAEEFAAQVRALGGELLAAFEKGDAEYLASLRAGQERELAELQLAVRKDQWRDADWQVEALQKTKAVSQANLAYYKTLLQNGLINDEIAYRDLTDASVVLRAAGDVSEGIASAVGAIPNMFNGVAGFGGTPLFYMQLPVGQPLASIFSTVARIMDGLSQIASTTAGLELTEASWQRRADEWTHQTQILAIEIEQIELQILGSQRRRAQAMNELNMQQRQLEQSTQAFDFLREKFTSHDLYLYLQKDTTELYYRMYDLALAAARQAERAFNLERGHTTRRFLPETAWDSLHEGLTAGMKLDVALRHMEKAYRDENVRERELTKYVSLREDFPKEYLQLRTTGYCEIDVPEWLFDRDYPGMYMRRIKNVMLTIPCVTGPYNGVQCRLTLLSSRTRVDPRLTPPPHRCCCDRRPGSEYLACACDPRMVRQYAAQEGIATSSGKSDGGQFDFRFEDERYIPFEYRGAVSRWRVELPPENNHFDLDTLSDFIMCLNYTAREGGEALRCAANELAQQHLPGDGWCFFDVRHDFPDSWELFQTAPGERGRGRRLDLSLGQHLFPKIAERRRIQVEEITLLFHAEGLDAPEACGTEQCACPERKRRAAYDVSLLTRREGAHHRPDKAAAACVASVDGTDLYYGMFPVEAVPFAGRNARQEVRFEFPLDTGKLSPVYLFCRYALVPGRD